MAGGARGRSPCECKKQVIELVRAGGILATDRQTTAQVDTAPRTA